MIISGKEISKKIKEQLKVEVEEIKINTIDYQTCGYFSRGKSSKSSNTLKIKKEDVLM